VTRRGRLQIPSTLPSFIDHFMPKARTDINWDAVKALWLSGAHTSQELAAVFDISPQGIRARASRYEWAKLKLEMLKQGAAREDVRENEAQIPEANVSLIARAQRIRGPESFRRRIAEQAEKVLDKLENHEPDSLRGADLFSEVLTKVEKVGARAYGIDSEESRPCINIAVLGSGNEYEPILPPASP